MSVTPKAAGIYCRLSFAPDGSLEKVERQEADSRELAERLRWPVVRVYSDNSRSAWQRNRKRPNWDQMLADLDAGVIDAIIVYHGDRLIRQPWDLELLLKLADDRRVPLASPTGVRDLNSEDDRFILRIEAAQACRSSADTSRRVRRGLQARAESGRTQVGSRRPFGFGVLTDRSGVTGNPIYDTTKIVEEEAEVIRGAVDRLLAGQSLGGVVAWMNTVSTTTEGKPWRPAALKAVLLRPAVVGRVEHAGKMYKAAWEPIIQPEQQEDVHAIFRRNSERHGYHGQLRKHLLSGIAECWCCEGPLSAKRTNGALQYYCRNDGCKRPPSRRIAPVDDYVSGRVLRLLNAPGFLETLESEQADPDVSAKITALEQRKEDAREQLANLADHPEVDAGLVAQSLASFDRRITELRERQEMTARERLLRRMAGVTREEWEGEPIDVRAETVRVLYRVVLVPPGRGARRFDPSTVLMTRR